tara:strand:+ start:91 stop:297 length:207 start_codon:yes stop_codon:yes gene_type:complete
LAFNKRQFYVNTPDGDTILTEVFQEDDKVTILLGENKRIDLDVESAFELADTLLILANDMGGYENEQY